MYVIPTAGLKVPDPVMQGTPGYFLPAEGREVEDSMYWARRVIEGDVTVGTPPSEAPSAVAPSAT